MNSLERGKRYYFMENSGNKEAEQKYMRVEHTMLPLEERTWMLRKEHLVGLLFLILHLLGVQEGTKRRTVSFSCF